jgi:hypothetical protein
MSKEKDNLGTFVDKRLRRLLRIERFAPEFRIVKSGQGRRSLSLSRWLHMSALQ